MDKSNYSVKGLKVVTVLLGMVLRSIAIQWLID